MITVEIEHTVYSILIGSPENWTVARYPIKAISQVKRKYQKFLISSCKPLLEIHPPG
jgi:hypothetical protein